MKLGRCSIMNAELWAILKGLELAWEKGYKMVEMEVDSLMDVKKILRDKDTINIHSSLIRAIQEFLKRDWTIQINHVYRESE